MIANPRRPGGHLENQASEAAGTVKPSGRAMQVTGYLSGRTHADLDDFRPRAPWPEAFLASFASVRH
ncbi:hypothetical protein LBMAG38_20020 [Chloroflexota bacterium]|nr:hypothetical protein LBMAG38_20020 [Chloroflexota bacterium]